MLASINPYLFFSTTAFLRLECRIADALDAEEEGGADGHEQDAHRARRDEIMRRQKAVHRNRHGGEMRAIQQIRRAHFADG